MSINELLKKVKQAHTTQTPEQRTRLLQEAHILDKNGNFHSRFFSKKTCQKTQNKT